MKVVPCPLQTGPGCLVAAVPSPRRRHQALRGDSRQDMQCAVVRENELKAASNVASRLTLKIIGVANLVLAEVKWNFTHSYWLTE